MSKASCFPPLSLSLSLATVNSAEEQDGRTEREEEVRELYRKLTLKGREARRQKGRLLLFDSLVFWSWKDRVLEITALVLTDPEEKEVYR